jgi:hypothetical protein
VGWRTARRGGRVAARPRGDVIRKRNADDGGTGAREIKSLDPEEIRGPAAGLDDDGIDRTVGELPRRHPQRPREERLRSDQLELGLVIGFPNDEAGVAARRNELGPPVTVEIAGRQLENRPGCAEHPAALRRGQPDADRASMIVVDAGLVATAVAVEIGKDGLLGTRGSRRSEKGTDDRQPAELPKESYRYSHTATTRSISDIFDAGTGTVVARVDLPARTRVG